MTTAGFTRIQRTVVLGPPLLLGVLESGHPALLPNENIFETLSPITGWWITLHLLQIPLLALMGLAVLLLTNNLRGRLPEISRWATYVFIVLYPAFDAAVGVGSGIIVRAAGNLEPGQRGVLEGGLQTLFWGPVTGSMALAASASWLIALVTAAWAWRRAGAALYAVAALALSGVLLAIAHIRPFGPFACLSFLIGAGWVVFSQGVREP